MNRKIVVQKYGSVVSKTSEFELTLFLIIVSEYQIFNVIDLLKTFEKLKKEPIAQFNMAEVLFLHFEYNVYFVVIKIGDSFPLDVVVCIVT